MTAIIILHSSYGSYIQSRNKIAVTIDKQYAVHVHCASTCQTEFIRFLLSPFQLFILDLRVLFVFVSC